jgi:hypothetical protein
MVVVVVEFQYVSTVVEKTSAYTAKESDVTWKADAMTSVELGKPNSIIRSLNVATVKTNKKTEL